MNTPSPAGHHTNSPAVHAWQSFLSHLNLNLQGVEFSFSDTLSLIRRRWLLLATSVAVCVGVAVLLLLVMPAQYTATALMQINTRQEQVTNVEEVVSNLSTSDASIRTEIDVLNSRRLATRVASTLRLDKNPEFLNQVGPMQAMRNVVTQFFLPMLLTEQNAAASVSEKALKLQQATDLLLENIDITIRPRSFTIQLRYTHNDPKLAASIANAFVQEYLNNQLEERFEATRRANTWLSARTNELRRNLQAAETAANRFREANGLSTAKGVLLSEQQTSELNTQLILARTQLAEAQAKRSSAESSGVGTAAEVLNNPLIQNLRIQETEVRRKMSDLAARYGERHPRMQTVRNELVDVQSKIGEETGKIRGSLGNNVAMAQARVDTLATQLNQLQDQTTLSSDASVQLAELERQAVAERGLYESFLNRGKEIAQLDFAQTDARIINLAEPPTRPSAPKKMLILMLALAVGLALGVGLMVLLESLDNVFRSPEQLEKYLAAPVLGGLAELPEDTRNIAYVVEKPSSSYSESLRAVRTAMQYAAPDKTMQVVMVTSSIPREGKSHFASSLALLAASGGQKVLLVDADLRRPTVADKFSLTPKAGLAELLIQTAKPKDVLVQLPDHGQLSLVPTLAHTQFTQELLNSQRMRDLLAEWRKTYDLIVLDSPPVMAVADALTLSSMADAVLFMVRWGQTPRPLVASAIKQLQSANAPLAGTVMTRVNLEQQARYGYSNYGYYYGKYKDYYND